MRQDVLSILAPLTFPYSYLSGLYTYTLSFSKRTQPLVDIESLQRQAEEEFASLWEEGNVPGWESKTQAPSSEGEIWCAACTLP